MSKPVQRQVKIASMAVAALVILAAAWMGFAYHVRSVHATTNVVGTVKKPDHVTAITEVATVCFHGPMGTCQNTDGSGAFNIALTPGHYKASAQPSFISDYAPSPEVDVDVYADQTTTLTLYVSTVQMKGRLLKPDGTPAARGNVNVHSSDFMQFSGTQADEQGYYKLGGLTPGSYIAEAMPPFESSGLTSPAPVNVTLGSTVVTQNFQFVAATKTITGSVRKSDGTPVSAGVNAFRTNGPGNSPGHTDGSGNYTLSVSGGTWNVQPNPDPVANCIYSDPPIMASFADDTSVETRTINFTCQNASSTIQGTVKDASGAPVSNGNVDARSQDGRGMGARLNADGSFSLKVNAGTYNLFLWTPQNDKMLPPTTVVIGDNEVKTLNLVVAAKAAKIRGRITTAAGGAANNVEVNANMMNQQGMGGGGPSGWSNTRTDASGNYELAVTSGTWGVHLGMSPDSNFVAVDMKPCDVSVPTDTSVMTSSDYSCLNMTVQQADATITGRVLDNDTREPVTQFPGCAYARAVGSFNENCSPINNGTFTIKISSAVSTQWEVGCHTGPNSDRSCPSPQLITVTPNGTGQAVIYVTKNDSSISGSIVDSSGFPLSGCGDLRGMVFADGMGVGAHYQSEVKSDCTYAISLVAGTYQIGTNFDPKSGVVNKPPSPEDQVIVLATQNVKKNISIAKADAKITGVFLGPDGKPTQGFVNAENRNEIGQSRELDQGKGKGADIGFNKKMPCGATDIQGVMKCCKDPKNQKQCQEFPVPDGPNGCKDAYSCVQQCSKDPKICQDAEKQQGNQGPQVGQDFKGPGGCTSETECKAYCSRPENMNTCMNFKPPSGAMSVRVGMKASAVPPGDPGKGPGGPGGFDNAIRAGGPTGPDGKFELNVLSGHVYQVGGGLPPESGGMPPKEVTCDLTKTKTCNVVLQARTADATIEGKVTINKNPADRCFVHALAEDGGFSGSPCNPGGQYKVNITKGTTWHVGADSFDGSTFYRSEEQTVVVGSEKKIKLDLALVEGKFRVPEPVTTNFSCTSQATLTLDNGTTLNIPASAISTDDGTCSVTATPTINTVSKSGAERVGVAYDITARDANGQEVSDLLQPVTFKMVLDKDGLSEEGINDTSALTAASYDDSTGSYVNETDATVGEQSDGDVAITFSADHFSAYTALNSGGSASKLKTVTVTTKNKKTSFTVGSKKVTPFTKGTVTCKTALVASTQVIACGSTEDKLVKVYNTSGKLTQKLSAFPVQSLVLADLTKDGKNDLLVSSAAGTGVRVYDISGKKAKAYNVSVSGVVASASIKTVATAMNLGSGAKSLVIAFFDQKNAPVGSVQVYDFSKKKFKSTKSSVASYLKAKSGSISYSVPSPTIKSISPSAVSASNSAAKLTLKGKNFEPNTSVQVCDTGATVTFKSTTQLSLVLDATSLTAGKCSLTVTNSNGDGAIKKNAVTVN